MEIDDVDNTTTKEYLIPIDHESFYDGRVYGEIKSSATVHLEDGLLTAKIVTPEDTYHIEPSWRHFSGNLINIYKYAGLLSHAQNTKERKPRKAQKQTTPHLKVLMMDL